MQEKNFKIYREIVNFSLRNQVFIEKHFLAIATKTDDPNVFYNSSQLRVLSMLLVL